MATTILWQELTLWPASKPATAVREDDPFRATYNQTLRELSDELRRIDARDIIVQVDMAASQLRKRDGAPFADAPVRKTPGVVLTFKSKQGHPVSIPSDRFKSWEANLRAIALTLHDLRRIDRYGTAGTGEQYRGWAALPAITLSGMSADSAAAYLARYAGKDYSAQEILRDIASARLAARRALAATHPENGGKSEDFAHTTDASRALAKHFSVEKL